MAEFSGHLQLRAERRADGRTTLAGQSFRAPFHVSKPYWDIEAATLLVQVVNPTAGILEGDRLESDIAVEAGAALCVTTPSASRVFTMRAGTAVGRQRFTVAEGGWLEVVPEPLVPHRGSDYRQLTEVEVARGGELFFVDQLVSGRVAHGESWAWSQLRLELAVRWGGELIVRERLDQSGEALRGLATLAGVGEAACFANAILITAQTEAAWRPAVTALQDDGCWVGVSALRKGGWSLKVIAPDGVRLRRALKEMRLKLSEAYPRLRCDLRKL